MATVTTLVGYIPYASRGPTFLVPLFKENPGAELRVQIPTSDGDKVEHFLELTGRFSPIFLDDITASQSVGAEVIYGFRFADGKLIFGVKQQLIPELKKVLHDQTAALSIRTQIASFVPHSNLSNLARNEFSAFAKEISNRTFVSYLNSLMRSYAWDRIASFIADDEVLDRFLEARSYFDFFLDSVGTVRFQDHGSGLNLPYGLIDDIIRELGVEFKYELSGASFKGADEKYNYSNDIGRAVSKAKNYKRQEERLAVLFSEMLEKQDPRFVLKLINEYNDRAKFANEALAIVKKNLEKANDSVPVTEDMVADLLPHLCNRIFWSGQPYLLYAFAKKLGQYKAIRAEIEYILDRSSSLHIKRNAWLIREELQNPTGGDFDDEVSLFHFSERNTNRREKS